MVELGSLGVDGTSARIDTVETTICLIGDPGGKIKQNRLAV